MSGGPFLSSSWYRIAGLCPKLREHATLSRHRYRGRSWYVINDHATGRAHRLSSASYLIVGGMDGTRTADQLWREAADRLGEEAPSQDEFIQLLAQFHSADLVQTEVTSDCAELLERAEKLDRAKWLGNVLNPLALRLRFWHPDKFFERTLPLVNWLVSWRGGVLWLAAVSPAVLLTAQHWQELTESASDRILAADNVLLIGLTFLVLKTLHELGHGYAVKAFGGAVHEIGVMFLVFAPMPYVDASAASEFRSKWQRALVGAAGMIVEVFVASLALYIWLAVEPGLVRALAFNAMVVAGVSTVLFNGNPLLRYDGYYILTDLLEIPNLAQRANRYWGYLLESYAFRTEGLPDFVATPGEKIWLFLYAPASFLYRTFVIFAIALFIASEYLAVGVLIALWGLCTGIFLPLGKGLWHVLASPRLQRNRAHAVVVTAGFILVGSIVLFSIPAPLYTTTEGVVWLPENANVRAGTGGFVRRLLVEPGSIVSVGEALVESEEPTLKTEIEFLQARVSELEIKLASEQFTDRAKAEITRTELEHARSEFKTATQRAERLIARSQGDGVFTVLNPQDLPARFAREGQLIAYVLPPGSRIVRATVGQDDIDLVRNRLVHTIVKLAERLDENVPARVIREIPAGQEDLPSKALGGTGGGALPIDPRDPQGTKTLQRVFQLDIELPSEVASAAVFGSRVYVRFELQWEPIGLQIWRRARQLVLARLQA
jgi:putative peptide zinc metalloprotease protein